MRHAIFALATASVLFPTVVLAQANPNPNLDPTKNPLFPSGNPFNPVVPNNNNGNGPSVEDIMRLRMMQQMMNGRRNPPKYGAGGMRAPMFNGQYQNPILAPFAPPQAPAVDPAKVARDTEKAKAKQRADDIRAKDAAARERRKAKLLEEKAARDGQIQPRPLPQPSEKVEDKDEERPADEKKSEEKADEEKAADKAE